MSGRTTSFFEFSSQRASSLSPRSVLRRLALMLDAWRTRQQLSEMDPRMLKDIGLSRSDARVEASRAPWDIDPRW